MPQKLPVVQLAAVAFLPQKKQQKMAQGGPMPLGPPWLQASAGQAALVRGSSRGFSCTRSLAGSKGGLQAEALVKPVGAMSSSGLALGHLALVARLPCRKRAPKGRERPAGWLLRSADQMLALLGGAGAAGLMPEVCSASEPEMALSPSTLR